MTEENLVISEDEVKLLFNGDIITKRPENMSFENYKIYLKQQKQYLKERKNGILFYKASEIWYAPEDKHKMFGLMTKYPPFKGKMKEIIYPLSDQNASI